MWRKSLDTGEIPNSLKNANIAPIFKGGDRSEAKNYRPVALTSHLIKIFERVIRDRINNFLEATGKFNKQQHGFRTGRSCLSQLIEHYDNIIEALEEQSNIDVIYTDFAKAFDKCDHGVIAHKLLKVGITGKLGIWIFNFLTGRKQNVIVEGVASQDAAVVSSVPQGTVLAPLIFLILIADIDKDITNCHVTSFADDTKISKIITNVLDLNDLQSNTIKLFDWADENNMQFNSEKFQLIRYGKKENLKLNIYSTKEGTEIRRKPSAKDLGVIMTDDAKFQLHCQITCSKAKKNLRHDMEDF
jgi:hypothetical protein